MVVFDCRGLEPVEWECRGGLVAASEAGRKFEVELEDGEWYDYDDQANESISMTGFRNQGIHFTVVFVRSYSYADKNLYSLIE